MKLLLNKNETPSGQWKYTEPSTGVFFKTYAWDQMIDMVRKHKKGNQIEMPPDWVESLENEVCHQNPHLDCFDPEKVKSSCDLSLTVLRRFLATMWHWLKGGGNLVDQSLAESRADICASCPNNKHVHLCFACKGLTGIVRELKGERGTKRDPELNSCSSCCCVLQVKVHIPLEAMDDPSIEYPSWCWMNKEKESDQESSPSEVVG